MLTGITPRRTAAALTAVLAAVLLVALGGTSRTVVHSHRDAAGPGHSSAMSLAARAQYVIPASPHHDVPLHLDLSSTSPTSSTTVQQAGTHVDVTMSDVRNGHDRAAQLGRAPPAV